MTDPHLTPRQARPLQVASTLARFPCLTLDEALPRLGSRGRPGGGLSEEHCGLVQRFEPTDGTEGFFIARFIKTSDIEPEDEPEGAACVGEAEGNADATWVVEAGAQG